MGKKGPRRGSLAYWHRKRARTMSPRVRAWPSHAKGLLGYAGYKAGMAHLMLVEDRDSPLKGQEVVRAVTVVETPPLFVYAAVGYKKTPYGLKAFAETPALFAPKEIRRALTPAKKAKHSIDALKDADEVRLIVTTQPWKTGLKKTPEVLEVGIGGSPSEKLEFARAWLGKEIPVQDVFAPGQIVDVIAVTQGSGWQGVVKRFGVALNPRKATKSRRHGGSIGGERQAKVMYSIPRPGQMGFHRRTDRNKRILVVGSHPDAFKPNTFREYGRLSAQFMVIEGSVPGPAKRLIVLRPSLIAHKQRKPELRDLKA